MANIFKKKENPQVSRSAAIAELDQQIIVTKQNLVNLAANPGVNSKEYTQAVTNLSILCDARAKLAESENAYVKDAKCDGKSKVDPNVIIGVVGGLAQVGLMFWFEREHVLPKSAGKIMDTIKGCNFFNKK